MKGDETEDQGYDGVHVIEPPKTPDPWPPSAPGSEAPPEPPFVDALRSFDSHERGILLQWATGTAFDLSPQLRTTLSKALGVQAPPSSFVAMDYTLDWLYAAMTSYLKPDALFPLIWPQHDELKASGEDVDLLVAWQDSQPRLILIEAKGFTGWSNAVLLGKAQRLGAIFTTDLRARVDVHFVLVGPKHAAGIDTSAWPRWLVQEGRYHFVELPDPGPRRAVQRCTSDGKASSTAWTHWRVIDRKWS